jgi:Protein of unknwon function (DUF3008)
MDFKSILNKFSSIEALPKAVEAPKLADPIRLDEGTELRVLAGVTKLTESVIAEKSVSKAQQKFMGMVHATKKGEKAPSKEVAKAAKGMSDKEAEKFASTKHKGLPEKKKKDEAVEEGQETLKKTGDTYKTAKGGTVTKTSTGIKHTKSDYSDDDHVEEPKKKVSKAGMTGAERRAQKGQDKEQAKASKDYEKKYPGSVTRHKMKEAAKPDFLDMDKDGDKKEPMKKAVADKKKGAAPKKGVNPFAKKKVDESLSFKKAMQIVKESQGDFQIDPLDKALWSWAERVGKSKFTESVQAQAFAAVTYEKMGGEWNLHKIIKE